MPGDSPTSMMLVALCGQLKFDNSLIGHKTLCKRLSIRSGRREVSSSLYAASYWMVALQTRTVFIPFKHMLEWLTGMCIKYFTYAWDLTLLTYAWLVTGLWHVTLTKSSQYVLTMSSCSTYICLRLWFLASLLTYAWSVTGLWHVKMTMSFTLCVDYVFYTMCWLCHVFNSHVLETVFASKFAYICLFSDWFVTCVFQHYVWGTCVRWLRQNMGWGDSENYACRFWLVHICVYAC